MQTLDVKHELTNNTGLGIGDAVRVATFLGIGQVDLTVEPHGVEQVSQHLTILNYYQLSSWTILSRLLASNKYLCFPIDKAYVVSRILQP